MQLLENNYIPIKISISIGIASKDCHDTINSLIKKADSALYYSKLSGKDTITIFEKEKIITKKLV